MDKYPIEIFKKIYEGFEDIVDLERDISEMWNDKINPLVKDIPSEFKGSVQVRITYVPYISPKAKLLELVEDYAIYDPDERRELIKFINTLEEE